jgi:hypothetical protein
MAADAVLQDLGRCIARGDVKLPLGDRLHTLLVYPLHQAEIRDLHIAADQE